MNIIKNYDTIDAFNSIIVFDLETTGLNRTNDRIIEIGAIKIKDGTVKESLSILVDPGIPIPYYATKVNGITNDMVKGEITDNEGVMKFYDMIGDSLLVAHNISFDLGFINEYLKRLNITPLSNNAVDTVRLARKAFPGKDKYKLGIIAKELGIEVKNAHRAYDDARVCYEVFEKSIKKLREDKA